MLKSSLVLVYGTLREGGGNHRLLENASLVGTHELTEGFRMVSLGWFPGVLHATKGEEAPVYGEVYRVSPDEMYDLDRLEGHPDFYKRELVGTPYGEAWMYVLPHDEYASHPPVETGRWIEEINL